MSRAPWQRADGGLVPRHHRATTRRRRGLIPPREQGIEEVSRDARVRGGWLGHAAGSLPHGGMDGRFHGGYPSRYFTAGDSCVHGGHPSRNFTAGDSSRLSMASRIREKADRLESELDSIDTFIVATMCLSPEARSFYPDSTWRLDRYLVAAKCLMRLDTSGDIDRRKKILLQTAMSSLAEEFRHLSVWRLDDEVREHSPASIWESIRRSCSRSRSPSAGSDDSRLSSSGSFTGTGGTSDVSYGSYHTDPGEEPSVQSHNRFVGMIYIERRSLSILRDIAGVMIGAGYEHMLRGAFDRHCTQIARHIEILDIDNIFVYHMEEPREILLKVWTSAMHIIIGFLSEMQRQLDGQDFGSFNKFKEDYFLSIAKVSVTKIFNSASSIVIQVDPTIDPSCENSYAAVKRDLSKMVNVVLVYQALNHRMPTILSLFSGQAKEFIIAEAEGLINRLSDIFVKLSVELNNLVRSQHLLITSTSVLRFTKHVMNHTRLLIQEKWIICILLNDDLKAFGELVTRLILSLEFMLNVNSRSLQLQGQQQIFLLNNVHFMLEEADKNTDLGLILGKRWFSRCHDQLEQCIAGYVDASWTPVMSSLEKKTGFPTIFLPQQLLYKSTSFFEKTYSVQKNWKVTDPLIRHKLREAIFQKFILLYRMHMQCDSEKTHKSVRYSIEHIESQLLELFEG